MGKIYTALGLMSGTSMDGIDASIIKSDGNTECSIILDKYFEYKDEFHKKLMLVLYTLSIPELQNQKQLPLDMSLSLFDVFVYNLK